MDADSSQIETLYQRTGIKCVIIGAHSNLNMYNQPYHYVTTQRVANFFEHTFKASVPDIGLRLEAFLISGVQGEFSAIHHSYQVVSCFIIT